MHGNLEIIVVDKDSFGDLMMLIITFMMIDNYIYDDNDQDLVA